MHQQNNHADVARNGKDIDASGCFLSNVDLLVRDVVANGECLHARGAGFQSVRYGFLHLGVTRQIPVVWEHNDTT